MKINLNTINFKILFAVVLLLGIGLRFYYMVSSDTILSTDETVYGVQAFNILHGERSVFYYNQNYTGTLSAFISAIFFYLFGVQTLLVKFPVFLFSVVFLVSAYFLGKIIFDAKVKGLLVMILTAFTAPFWMNWTTRAGSGYPETMVFGNLIFILVLKTIFENRTLKFQRISFFIIGLLGGLGYWTQPTIVYYLLPAALFIFFWKPKIFFSSLIGLGILGFVIGSLPVIVFNLNHQNLNTASLFHKPFGIKKAAVDFFVVGLPIIFGLRKSFSTADFIPVLTGLVTVIYLVGFIWLIKNRFLDLVTTFSLGVISKKPKLQISFGKLKKIDLILLFFISVFSIFVLSSPFNQFVSEPRYISPLYTGLPILIVYFASLLSQKQYFLGAAIFSLILVSQIYGLYKLPPASFQGQIKLDETIEYLNSKNIKYVDTISYISYRLILETDGQIIGATRDFPPIEARYPKYRELVKNAPKDQLAVVLNNSQPLAPCTAELEVQTGPCIEKKMSNGLYVYTWR